MKTKEGIATEIAKKEGLIRDLIEKKKRGELTSEDAVQELLRRGLGHERYPPPWIMVLCILCMMVGASLCFISIIPGVTHAPILGPIIGLFAITFPPIIRYSAVILIPIGIIWAVLAGRARVKKGGGTCGETITLVKEGIYGITRHPELIGTMLFFIPIIVFLSEYVPFNILSVIGILIFFLANYYGCVREEKLNILKWGDEYRQYMKEVPRWNFIKGLWNLRKRR